MINYCKDNESGFEEMIKDYMAFRTAREKVYSCGQNTITKFYDDALFEGEVTEVQASGLAKEMETEHEDLISNEKIDIMKDAYSDELKMLKSYAEQIVGDEDNASESMVQGVTESFEDEYTVSDAALAHNQHGRRKKHWSTVEVLICIALLVFLPASMV